MKYLAISDGAQDLVVPCKKDLAKNLFNMLNEYHIDIKVCKTEEKAKEKLKEWNDNFKKAFE